MVAPLRERARELIVAVVAAAFLSLSGAFGSGSAPYLHRLGYWLTLMVTGTLLGGMIARWVEARGWFESKVWLQAALVAALITLPLTVWVWAVTELAFGEGLRLGALPYFLGPVAIVSVVMTAITSLASRRPRKTHASAAPDAPAPRFHDRLPVKLKGADLYAVSAEDHYLRLHTSRGSDLILMRLSDAISELEGVEGAQTHRSWWVAKEAVTKTTRGEGRASLTLKDGTEAPVSRTYVKVLRDEGWFRT